VGLAREPAGTPASAGGRVWPAERVG
jgi:hypothetical protein